MIVETLSNRTYLTARLPREPGHNRQHRARSAVRDTIDVTASGFDAENSGTTTRLALVNRIRREVDAGAYLTRDKLGAAVDRLIAEVSRSDSEFN